ncbi:ATP-binding protein [Thermococci archaeon]|nr:MAG: ATP-binding protein [Thermococci archaeon]
MEDLIVLQNPWWRDKDEIYNDEKIKAVFSKKNPLRYFFKKRNKVIIGPRQVGKTTYLKLSILDLLEKGTNPRNVMYFSCDLLRNYREIIEVIRTFERLSMGEKYVFLDEVTFVSEWERAIKFFLDSPLSRNVNLYVTGSTSTGIKRESFPGRPIKIEEFLPLSFRKVVFLLKPEFKGIVEKLKAPTTPEEVYKNALDLYPYYDELMNAFYFYLNSGGYPKAIYELMDGEISLDTYEMIYNATIFDITRLGRSERIALSIVLGILRRYGDRVSLNSLAKELEIGAHTTVRDYLELFEELFIGRNYFQADLKSFAPLLRKGRKVYFIDPLVVNTFSRHFGFDVDISKKVEGVVGEHLKRNFETYFFYGKREVDFVTKRFGVEVKWQNKVKASDFPRVGIKNKLLLSKKNMEFVEGRNLAIIPVPLFLIQLP